MAVFVYVFIEVSLAGNAHMHVCLNGNCMRQCLGVYCGGSTDSGSFSYHWEIHTFRFTVINAHPSKLTGIIRLPQDFSGNFSMVSENSSLPMRMSFLYWVFQQVWGNMSLSSA